MKIMNCSAIHHVVKSHKEIMFNWNFPFIHIITFIDKAELLSVSPDSDAVTKDYVDKQFPINYIKFEYKMDLGDENE